MNMSRSEGDPVYCISKIILEIMNMSRSITLIMQKEIQFTTFYV